MALAGDREICERKVLGLDSGVARLLKNTSAFSLQPKYLGTYS